jgi:thiamine monophosphate synthase
VFGTTTKAPGVDPVGVELVRYAAGLEPARPVVAIGGITLERVPSMVEAGATSVAVVSDLLVTGDPEARVKDYVDALSDAK